MRHFRALACITIAAAMSWAALGNAQESDEQSVSEATEAGETNEVTEVPEELLETGVIDEIMVIVGPEGQTAFELEMQRQVELQEAIFAEMRLREREAEEVAWRQADPDLQTDSRIKWGYSPQAEQRMRRENDFMYDWSTDQTKPASVFSAEF